MLLQSSLRRLAPVVALLVAAGCATFSPIRPALVQGASGNEAELARAAEAFYAANDVSALTQAVADARAAAPASGTYHELAAELALLEMRAHDAVDHLIAACADLTYDTTSLQLLRVDDLMRTDAQHAQYLGLLQALSTEHPRAEVRGTAAFLLAQNFQVQGDDEGRDQALRILGAGLPFAVVGGWDNDQGKGFDLEQPPERGVDLSATYDGALMPIRWVANPPRDVFGEIELREFLAPDKWSVAYAATGVQAASAGEYELRLSTTDPVKVWVNGMPVFEGREINGRFVHDQFVIPITLPAGQSQILVKSAHRTSDWRLYARLTGKDGAPVQVTATAAGPVTQPGKQGEVLSAEAAQVRRLEYLPSGSARRARFETLWTEAALGGNPASRVAQEYAQRAPGALFARYELAGALWSNGERGRTADELASLVAEAGDALPLLKRQQARFWLQEGLRQKARKSLVELTEKYADRPIAALQLADLFEAERWTEDRCRVLEQADRVKPQTLQLQLQLADCFSAEGREDRAIAMYREVLSKRPRHLVTLKRLHDALRERGRYADAADTMRALIRAWPEHLWPRIRLADTLRRGGKVADARVVLTQARELFPNSADVLRAQAALAWRLGEKDQAIEAWQAALERNPDDEATANRLDFLAPAAMGPWAQDIPDEQAIGEAVMARQSLEPRDGADLAYLLDHEVTQLRSDGSTINVVTVVMHALNQAGRDKLTRQRLQYGARSRVLAAFSIDASGRRSEASVRPREVLYRGLDVGSTTVLQYRADAPPSGFLPRYLSKSWFFQGVGEQRRMSQLVLWYPTGNTLHEVKNGTLEREEKKVGEETRVAWTLRDGAPLVLEPGMPTILDVAANIQLTTTPSWDSYKKWEEALLEGAFRTSPELDALATRLSDGATTVDEKLLRIHQFVMEEIRYEQDYESFIAGVKPHPASMVIERRYGDCKDKTVLFMTLAKKLGIRADFATVRTRDRGQIRKGLPTQQFNHAIVYVPPQAGLEEGRFYDATADALDLDVLRDDNAGTEALVYNPDGREFSWVQIPWQTPGHHTTTSQIAFSLAQDGSAKGEIEIKGRGRSASVLRRVTRNPEKFRQFMQMVAGAHFTGAATDNVSALEVKDLRAPAKVRMSFSAPNAARTDGQELRVRIPTDWSPKQTFSLAQRRHDLVLGTPNEQHWRFDIRVPDGMQISRAPSSGEVSTPCLTLQRRVTPSANGLAVEQSLRVTCERIAAADYPAYRTQMEQMSRFLDEELVVGPQKTSVVKPARATRKR